MAPEEIERLVEDRQVLVARHQDGRQRSTEILAAGDADRVRGVQCGEGVRGTGRQPRRPEHADEMHDVLRKVSGHPRFSPAAVPAAGASPIAMATRRRPRRARRQRPRFDDLRTERRNVVLVLEQYAGGVGDRRGSAPRGRGEERIGPVKRLGNSRRLEELLRTAGQTRRSRGQALRRPGPWRTIASSRATSG